jgi:hypothetical protein
MLPLNPIRNDPFAREDHETDPSVCWIANRVSLRGGVYSVPRPAGSSNTMNRYCTAHSHRGGSRAYRMILAKHSLDRDAHRHVVDEHGDCPECWRDTCLAAVDAANNLLIRSAGAVPHMDAHGNCSGPTVDWLLGRIDTTLACEQADRRDLEP